MELVTLRFIAVNAEYSDQLPETMEPTKLRVDCDLGEPYSAVVKRAGIDAAASRLWTDYMESESMPLWVLPATYALNAGRLQSDTIGSCILHPDVTVGDIVAYFGPLATDRSEMAVYPTAPIGGSLLDFLVELGETSQRYFSRSPLDVTSDLLTLYGGAGILLSLQRRLARRRLRRLHRDGRAWLHNEHVTRRVALLVASKQTWRCHELAKILDLDDLSTGRLLASRGFTLSSEDLTTWTQP